MDTKGNVHPVARKAIQLYGDSLGATHIRVTRNEVDYSAAGGNDNSIVTNTLFHEAGSVTKFGIRWGFSFAILKSLFGNAASSYAVNQNASAARAAAVKPAAPLPSVGATIPAQTAARVVPVP